MPDSKLVDLTAEAAPVAADLVYVVREDVGDFKVTIANLAASAPFAAASSRWALVDRDTVRIVSGNITLNATAITDLTATQLTLQGAATGDVVTVEPSFIMGNTANYTGFDAYTYVSAVRTNPFSVGLSASLASTQGHSAWICPNVAALFFVCGRNSRTLVSGDISGGNVTVGMAYAKDSVTARTLSANANNPFQFTAELWRPPV